jgi:Rap1a immunity proteins
MPPGPEGGEAMRGKGLLIVLALVLWPLLAEAVTRDNFLMRTARDYVDVSSTPENDPLYQAAMGFCQGYGVGVWHYYLAATADGKERAFVCPPNPQPSRTEAIQKFLTWARANPQVMDERPVDAIFRFLASEWPCRR